MKARGSDPLRTRPRFPQAKPMNRRQLLKGGLAWPLALAGERRYLERLARDCRALIKSGASLAQAAATAGVSEKPQWELFEEYNARNATAAFAELEWE